MPIARDRKTALRCWPILGIALGGAAWAEEPAPEAASEERASACMNAFEEAQRLRSRDQLVEARRQLRVCSEPDCQPAIRAKCLEWQDELELSTPTVVVVVRDANGNLQPDARVHVDGAVIPNAARGKPIEVDPGPHIVVVEAKGMGQTQSVTLKAGQKRVQIPFELAPSSEPASGGDPVGGAGAQRAPPSPMTDVQVAGLVVGGVGAVGVGLFGVFAGIGLGQEGDLADAGCEPRCSPDLVDDARTSYAVADVALVVGLTALAGGVVLFLVGGADESDPASSGRRPFTPDGMTVRF